MRKLALFFLAVLLPLSTAADTPSAGDNAVPGVPVFLSSLGTLLCISRST